MLRGLKRAVRRGTSPNSRVFAAGNLVAHKLTLPFNHALDLKRQPCADDFIVSVHGKRLEIDSAYLHQAVYESHSSLIIMLSDLPQGSAAIDAVRVVYIPMDDGMYIASSDQPGEYTAIDAFDEEIPLSIISAENSAYAEIALADEALDETELPGIDTIISQEILTDGLQMADATAIDNEPETHAAVITDVVDAEAIDMPEVADAQAELKETALFSTGAQAEPEEVAEPDVLTGNLESATAVEEIILSPSEQDVVVRTAVNAAVPENATYQEDLAQQSVLAEQQAEADATASELPDSILAPVHPLKSDSSNVRPYVTLFDHDDWACEINQHRVFLRLPEVLDLRHQPMVGDFVVSVDDSRIHCRAVLVFCESSGERPSLVFFLEKAVKGQSIAIDYLGTADSLRLIDGRSIAPFSFSQCLKTYRTSVGLVDPALRVAAPQGIDECNEDTLTHSSLELDPQQYQQDGWTSNSWQSQTADYFAGNKQARERLAERRMPPNVRDQLQDAASHALDEETKRVAPPNCMPRLGSDEKLFAKPSVEEQLAQATRSQQLMTRAMLATGLLGILCFAYFMVVRDI